MREKNMQERTNKRVQTITQNIDKVKGWKAKKRVASLQPSLITIALNKTKFTNP
jgi:NAD-dependent SIR2 family protein deacetylase